MSDHLARTQDEFELRASRQGRAVTGLPRRCPLPLGLLLVAAAWASPAQARQPPGKPTTITVTAVNSDDNGCGSHMGGFDAMYRGRRIAVWFFHEDLGRMTLDVAC